MWERHGAGVPNTPVPDKSTSCIITRDAQHEANLSLWIETHLPARLLFGLLPHTLLEDYVFWQDEDDNLRGYPSGSSGHYVVIYVRLEPGGHVGLCGGGVSKPQARQGSSALQATRAVVIRLRRERCEQRRQAVTDALKALESFCVSHAPLLVGPFVASFAVAKGMAHLLERTRPELATLAELLNSLDLAPFLRRHPKFRESAVLLPALLDALFVLQEKEVAAVGPIDQPL